MVIYKKYSKSFGKLVMDIDKNIQKYLKNYKDKNVIYLFKCGILRNIAEDMGKNIPESIGYLTNAIYELNKMAYDEVL